MPSVTLSGRAFLRLSGKDAETFLQALITTNLPDLPDGEVRPGALLTPQGKILFDFLIRRDGADALLIETTEDQRDALLKRLTMYKLRAAVDLAIVGDGDVTIAWDDVEADAPRDARFAGAGRDVSRRPGAGGSDDPALYDTLRISAGIVESGRDYALSDAFPHDIILDLTGGLSFRKGCYVGQEVVSRMQHRGTARRRPVIVKGDVALPETGTELFAGGKPIGTLGSVSGALGLAIVRIDRAADAMQSGTPITADGAPVALELPAWTGLAFPQEASEVPAQ
ncbi:folate-binding protein YgfZ [Sinorhizobium sp. RAC02]|uniref:CAF17-like 4Fe-4S cluster assembly/insertion protein YgfZ n=1 Tax=Sinorhizobium sp. RAC02 TaxID=1842534 RepID=UPI00083CAA2A|nr:folate-binding protein YgfZ [Sinorhizobium sp. RAC02]AOF90424.1 aminomethyltransferase folate-binding domain protein [Sinorhizobium sp. RAC02]